MLKAGDSSETLAVIYQATRHHIPEEPSRISYRRKNLAYDVLLHYTEKKSTRN
jgi:hypothetical protein